MARQRTYENDTELQGLDRLTGIDSVDNSTKNFTIADIAQFFASTGLSDSTRAGFHYNRDIQDTVSPSTGEISFSFVTGLTGFSGVTQIRVSRTTTQGIDFTPVGRFVEGNDIKITRVDEAGAVAYGIYLVNSVSDVDDITRSYRTLDVTHIASSGDIGTGTIPYSLSIVGATASDQRGSSLFDGSEVPTLEVPVAVPGDIYLHLFTDPDTLQDLVDLYVRRTNSWDGPTRLTGIQGLQGIQGIGITPGAEATPTNPISEGTNTEFNVDLTDPLPGAEDPTDIRFTVPPGAQGFQGVGIDTIEGAPANLGDPTTVTVTVRDPRDDSTSVGGTFDVQAGVQGDQGIGIDDVDNSSAVEAGMARDIILERVDPANPGTPPSGLNITLPPGADGFPVDGVNIIDAGTTTTPTQIRFTVDSEEIDNTVSINPGPQGPQGEADVYAGALLIALTAQPVVGNSVNLSITTGRSYTNGQHVRVGDASAYFTGVVTSHNSTTGALTLLVESVVGTLSTSELYDVNLSGGAGQQGPRGFSVDGLNVVSGGTTPGETTVIEFTTNEPDTISPQVTIQPGVSGVITNDTIDYQRSGDTDDIQILPSGQLRIHLSEHQGTIVDRPDPIFSGTAAQRATDTATQLLYTVGVTDRHLHYTYTTTSITRTSGNIQVPTITAGVGNVATFIGVTGGTSVFDIVLEATHTSDGSTTTLTEELTIVVLPHIPDPVVLSNLSYGFATSETITQQSDLSDIVNTGEPTPARFSLVTPSGSNYIYFITDEAVDINLSAHVGGFNTMLTQQADITTSGDTFHVYRSPNAYAGGFTFDIELTYN